VRYRLAAAEVAALRNAPAAGADSAVAEKHLRDALATARNRGALALELRAAADLRRLELANGRSGDAARILRFAIEKFTKGYDLPDLRDARKLLP
jgi:predicted ATPase